MSKVVKRAIAGVLVAAAVMGGTAMAFAQDNGTPAPTDEATVEEDVQFIGDPPGNDQTGEWEGDYEYEG